MWRYPARTLGVSVLDERLTSAIEAGKFGDEQFSQLPEVLQTLSAVPTT
jgi:hypothetical protein